MTKPLDTNNELRDKIRKITGMCEEKRCKEMCRYRLDEIMSLLTTAQAELLDRLEKKRSSRSYKLYDGKVLQVKSIPDSAIQEERRGLGL